MCTSLSGSLSTTSTVLSALKQTSVVDYLLVHFPSKLIISDNKIFDLGLGLGGAAVICGLAF